METASFGEWVRRRRRTLDLTQAELARRVACAPITVRKIEADERRPSKVMAERLAEALEVEGEARDRFVASARAVVSPARLPSPVTSGDFGAGGRLPAPATRCLGREDEVADVLDRLDLSGGPARLFTLTGPPGVGKTRLAIEVAARAERKFDTPVVWVDLSTVTDPGDVPARIASAVATPSAALVDVLDLAIHALQRSPALLVLDNFEHVLDAADHVQTLIEACPALVCLVTSRAPLDLYGEHVYPLGPLSLAPTGDDDQAPAVALFVERAQEADPRVDLASATVEIAAVCELLDGLPLAIELAARRTRALTVGDILAGLRADDGPGSLLVTTGRGRPERQRSVDGAVAWSVSMLGPSAQSVLAAASAFAGPFDADALATVASVARPVAVDAVDELVTNALVQRASSDPSRMRHRLLMVVREHGRHLLEAQGCLDVVLGRHAGWVADALEAVSPGIEAWPERASVDAMAELDADAQAALRWCFASRPGPDAQGADGAVGAAAPASGGPARDAVTGGRIVAAILPLWHFRGRVADCLHWSTALHDAPDSGIPRYQADYYLAVSRWSADDLDGARPLIEASVAGASDAGDACWLAEAIGMQQLFALAAGDIAGATELAPRCLEAADAAGPEWQLLAHLRSARLALFGGDLDTAADHVSCATAITAHHSGTWGRANVAGAAGDVVLARGEADAAVDRYLEAVDGFLAVDSVVYAIARVATIANAVAEAGDHERAASLCGLVDGWCDDLGVPLHPLAAFSYALHRAQLVEALGGGFDEAVSTGRAAPRTVDGVRTLLAPA